MSRQKWHKIYFSELQNLHIFHVKSGSVRAKTSGGGGGGVKLRKETSGESLNTIILNHFGQALKCESLKEIGRPPSFTSGWFSQTTVLKLPKKMQQKFGKPYLVMVQITRKALRGTECKKVLSMA